MVNKVHPTPSHPRSKSRPVVSDNREAKKPYPEYPLTPHPTGRWCKKVRGRLWYFGAIADGWQAALNRYKTEIDDIQAGRKPGSRNKTGLRLRQLCNRWLHHKRGLVNTGELKLRTWYDYHATCERLLKVFGDDRLVEDLKPSDFEKLRADFGRTWGPVKIGNEIVRTNMLFAYAFESDLIEKPVKPGPTFKPPSKKTLRIARKKRGQRMFEAAELRTILDAATQPLKSMILLAINGGLGNQDVGALPVDAIDLDTGWLDFPRPKTGVDRRIPLWPETVASIREWLVGRPNAKRPEDAELVFLTSQRRAYFRPGRVVEDENGATSAKGFCSPVTTAFKWLLKKVGVAGNRGFYSLRHGFETIAGDTGDQVAVNAIMGHADQSMAAVYRERIDPERLKRVVEHVRAWLFGDGKADAKAKSKEKRRKGEAAAS